MNPPIVERISAIISRVVYQHAPIEAAAREVLEASHHSELVEALKTALACLRYSVQSFSDAERKAETVLAKLGGDS
jgi:hypothetical protein